MEFTCDSGTIIKRLMPTIATCETNYNDMKKLTSVAYILYVYFQEAERYYNHNGAMQVKVYSMDECQHTELLESHFVPHKIRNYILNNVKHQLEYTFNILQRRVTITIDIFDKKELDCLEKYDKYIAFMCIHLYIFSKLSKSICSNILNIHLSLTSFKKYFPNENETSSLIGVKHVNSALTTRCSKHAEILIFRKEEWMKVFIHEAIHSFGLDIDETVSKMINEDLSLLFPIKSKFDISEAYTETWARIINAAFCSYESSKRNDEGVEGFITYFEFSLDAEQIFSTKQSDKLLQSMNLNYANLYKNTEEDILLCNTFYHEDRNTSAFAYYVLTRIFMNHYSEFMLWCYKMNKGVFGFQNTIRSSKEFACLVRRLHNKEPAQHICNTSYRSNLSARMSAIEIPL